MNRMPDSKQYKFVKTECGYAKLYLIFRFSRYCHTSYFTELHSKESSCSLYAFFTALKKISSLTWQQIKTNPRMFHFHEIPGDKAIYSEVKIREDTLLIQMKLTGDKESRLVGFFDEENIFNVVAYDYNHKIYPEN